MSKTIEPDIFSGFEAIIGDSTGTKQSNPTGTDDIPELDSISDLDDMQDDDSEDDTTKTKSVAKSKPVIDKDNDEEEDDEDADNDDEEGGTDGGDAGSTGTEDPLAEFEPQIAKFFQEKFAASFGLELGEEDKIESIADLVGVIKDEVAKASEPVYANDEIKSLNDFVTNGGKLADYLALAKPNGVDIDTLSVDNESDLKAAVQEKLRLQGYNADRIKRAISRYETSDTLQEEGEDAIDFLKDYKEKNQQKLLVEQEKTKKDVEQKQLAFVDTVKKRIESLNDIKGFKVSDKHRKELTDYIFKPGPDGVTGYQKQYMSDVLNLIESAYFTKYGDQLVKKANDAGQSKAYKDLHQKLAATRGKMRSSNAAGRGFNSDSDSLINAIGKHLL